MSDDPVADLLRGAKIPDAAKAGLWDLYHSAKNEDDLAGRLKALQLSDTLKADLWDLKAKGATAPSAPQAVQPSEGYWEDRGIGGKVWHPASGVSERNRSDVQLFGVPPELAALGAGAVGRAVIAPGLSAAGRVVAGATTAAGMAGPVIGNEVVRHTLKYAGMPEPFASILADIFTARGLAKRGVPAAATTAETAAAESAPVESSLDLTRRLRDEAQAASGKTRAESLREFTSSFNPPKAASTVQAATEAVASEVKSVAQKLKLSAEEFAAAKKMVQSGKTGDEVKDIILKLREMRVKFGLPTDATVKDLVEKANEAGRMVR